MKFAAFFVAAGLLAQEPAVRSQVEDALRARDFKRAETILVEEIARTPGSRELLLYAGGVFFRGGSYLNSVIALKKAEKLAPLEEPNRFTLAMGYVLIGRAAWARPELARLALDNPKSALYPYWQARLDYDDRKYSEAVARLRAALALDPEFVKAWDKLGLAYDMMGQPEDALAAYQKAVALNRSKTPAWAWAPLDLGTLLMRLARIEEAEPYLRESLRYDAGLAPAHYQLGVLLEKRNKLAEAADELVKAAALDASYAEPQYALGRVYRSLGRTEDANRAFAAFRRIKSRQRPDTWRE